jgi:hypothetical protein
MLPDAQLLTVPTKSANYNLSSLSSTARTLLASRFAFDLGENQESMAHHQHAPRNQDRTETELWFNLPSSTQQREEQIRAAEQSAYRATSHRLSTGSNAPLAIRHASGIPSISTTADTNKPLPPSPTESERKRRKPRYLRSILGRPSSSHLDPTHLRPEVYLSNHRYAATSTNLSLDTHGAHHAFSRSMPSSPYEYNQEVSSSQPVSNHRTHSTASNYADTAQYQPYTPPQHEQVDSSYFVRQQRSTSMNTYFESTPPRARTFPTDNAVTSPTRRERGASRPRPHTWLSPTESFSDASQYSLFVQATTGLPEDSGSFSPNAPPQLQGSLFARRGGNDTIPIPLQHPSTAAPWTARTDWQNFEPPAFTSRAVTAPSYGQPISRHTHHIQETPHIAAVNRELEMLGLEDDNAADEELPNYQQSQAEAHERQRAEASARARELEARWRSTRGR